MRHKIFTWLAIKHGERMSKKTPSLCKDCGSVTRPIKRMSVLNLLAWIALGSVLWAFTSFIYGFTLAAVLTFINARRLTPTCRRCFSQNIKTVTWTEIKELKEKALKEKEKKRETESAEVEKTNSTE